MGDKKVETLCEWKKDEYETQVELLRGIVSHARYVCRKCGRSARKKKYLCKPIEI